MDELIERFAYKGKFGLFNISFKELVDVYDRSARVECAHCKRCSIENGLNLLEMLIHVFLVDLDIFSGV